MAVCTLALLATSIYGITQLDIQLNLTNFLKVAEDEHQKRFLEAEKLFNKQGEGGIFMENLKYSIQTEREKLATLVKELEALDGVKFEQSWLSSDPPPPRQPNATDGGLSLADQSTTFNFSEEASMIPFKFFIPDTTSGGMSFMDEMDALVKAQVTLSSFQHFSRPSCQDFDASRVFVWLLPKKTWEYQMMRIIVKDMLINIGLTLLAIFAISLLMTVGFIATILFTKKSRPDQYHPPDALNQ